MNILMPLYHKLNIQYNAYIWERKNEIHFLKTDVTCLTKSNQLHPPLRGSHQEKAAYHICKDQTAPEGDSDYEMLW